MEKRTPFSFSEKGEGKAQGGEWAGVIPGKVGSWKKFGDCLFHLFSIPFEEEREKKEEKKLEKKEKQN